MPQSQLKQLLHRKDNKSAKKNRKGKSNVQTQQEKLLALNLYVPEKIDTGSKTSTVDRYSEKIREEEKYVWSQRHFISFPISSNFKRTLFYFFLN